MSYPEDIVNNMSSVELQNCDWDALFKRIENENIRTDNTARMSLAEENRYWNAFFDRVQNEDAKSVPAHYVPANSNVCRSTMVPTYDDSYYCHANLNIYESTNLVVADTYNHRLSSQSYAGYNSLPQTQVPSKSNDNKSQDVVIARKAVFIPWHGKHQVGPCKAIHVNSNHQQSESASGFRVHNNELHNISWTKQRRKEQSSTRMNENNTAKSDKQSKKNNLYNIYDNLDTVTATSKYGRRRKVLDMATVVRKKSRIQK